MKLRPYQADAVRAMLDCEGNGVVVLPTGSGKTLVMREFINLCGKRVLLLSHVKEILAQNVECLAGIPNVGLYSAGLNVQLIKRFTVAGIQSVYKKAHLFKNFDVALIDECHLINDEGMYHDFLEELGIPYIGLTATPYRLKQGYIYENSKLFDTKLYEAPVKQLTKDGYLSEIVMEGAETEMDTTGISLTGGTLILKKLRYGSIARV